MNKSRKYPDKCFLDPRINRPFTVNQEFLIRPISFHELQRSNENFQLSKADCLAFETTPKPRFRAHSEICSLPSQIFYKVHKSKFVQKWKMLLLLSLLLSLLLK